MQSATAPGYLNMDGDCQIPDIAPNVRMESRCPFNILPEELLLRIMYHLGGSLNLAHHDPRVLLALSLVNRKLNRVATPLMYAHVGPHVGPLRTFAAKPELLEHVRIIEWPFKCNVQLRQRSTERLKALIESIPLNWPIIGDMHDRCRWLEYIEMGAILCQTPNVRIIDFDRKSQFRDDNHAIMSLVTMMPLFSHLDGIPESNFHGFNHLVSLTADFMGCSRDQISHLFRLPRLKKLVVCTLHSTSEKYELGEWKCVPRTSTIEFLTFRAAFSSPDTILSAINSCQSLQQFEVGSVEFSRQFFVDLVETLTEHKDTLKELEIRDPCLGLEGDPIWSLKNLTAVELVSVPMRLVLGVGGNNNLEGVLPKFESILPPSAHFITLHISGGAPFKEITLAIESLFTSWSTHFKDLKGLGLNWTVRDPNHPALPADFVGLKRLSAKSDIFFEYSIIYPLLISEHEFLNGLEIDETVETARNAIEELPDGEILKYHIEMTGGGWLFDLPDRDEVLKNEGQIL